MLIVTQDGAKELAKAMDKIKNQIGLAYQWFQRMVRTDVYDYFGIDWLDSPKKPEQPIQPYKLKSATNSDAYFITIQANDKFTAVVDFSDYQPKPYRWK